MYNIFVMNKYKTIPLKNTSNAPVMNLTVEVLVMREFRLNDNHGSLNNYYIDRMIDTINRSLADHPRTMAIRVDLRLPYIPNQNCHMSVDSPTHFYSVDEGVITRFFSSLQAQIEHDQNRKMKDGKRVHWCNLRYIWVREISVDGSKFHYHVLLLLNKDAYAFLGNASDLNVNDNLISKIRKAWVSALRGDYEQCWYLVHLPENPIYFLNENNSSFSSVFNDLVYRVSYMAKDVTKPYGDGNRCFGCSQR